MFFLYGFSLAHSQPDSRDSVIIESKTVKPGAGTPTVYVRVFFTNKDTLAAFSLPLLESSTTGGAYLILSRPRTYSGVVHPLTTTLQYYQPFNGNNYNDASPDTIGIWGIWDPTNKTGTGEPPNLTRKAFLEIKFDTIRSNNGTVELDSTRIRDNVISFFTQSGSQPTVPVPVNFVKGTITVDGTPPSVTVTNPNGGESVPKPCPYTITWNATDNIGVTGIEIRLDRFNDGVFEQQIANLSSNPGSYNWTPGGTNSTHAKIKIIASDGAGNSAFDKSDNPFLITTYCLGKADTVFDINKDGVSSLVDVILVINSVYAETEESSLDLSKDYIQSMLIALFSESP
jgi:hypothetical protein